MVEWGRENPYSELVPSWPVAGPGLPSLIAFRLGATAPKVQIVSPASGGAIAAGDLTVQAEALNFQLVDQIGAAAANGVGHIVFTLDGGSAAAGSSIVSVSGGGVFPNVAPGVHTLRAELVNNDGTSLVAGSPLLKLSTAADTTPRVRIESPANGDILKSGSLTASVGVDSFTVVDPLGRVATPGEGQVRYSLDGGAPETTGATTHSWANVQPGVHAIAAELVTSDGQPLVPAVVASISVYVIQYSGGVGSQ